MTARRHHLPFVMVLLSIVVLACGRAAATAVPSSDASSAATESSAENADLANGDIPDNAVFLRYDDSSHGFAIVYVEGWQVTPKPTGVEMRDKDSSETIEIQSGVTDAATYIETTDLPALSSLVGFRLETQDSVAVSGDQIDHLRYHAPAPPDPVTGKAVASTIDRYYVPGTGGLAVVTLSTPDGVDNIDAFREMIQSFTWT